MGYSKKIFATIESYVLKGYGAKPWYPHLHDKIDGTVVADICTSPQILGFHDRFDMFDPPLNVPLP